MNTKEYNSLYESIMKEIAVVVKRSIDAHAINEAEEIDAPETIEFETIDEITREQYYNPKMNKAFSSINDDFILYNPETDKIGMVVNITDKNSSSKDSVEFEFWAESFGKLLERFDIAVEASTQDVHEKFFQVTTNVVMKKFWKSFVRHAIVADADIDALEENIDDFFVNFIEPAKTVEDVKKAMLEMSY